MESILKKLQNLSESDFYPYHMPGHKRCGNEAFALDITEIDDFDNLHHATGMLKEAQERAAKLYGALDSYFLVNGSTCGILAAVSAAFHRGDKVIVARNCHKAVYHALELRGLEPVYLYPDQIAEYDINNRIRPVQVAELLEKEDKKAAGKSGIKGMILTSPTYEGYASEIDQIAELLHSRGMVFVVDEAHGAHFGFHERFPETAVKQGADLVIQSLHKTLPSMTQTAVLHRCSERVAKERIQKYLAVFQTSSPSYVFMGHMDNCIRLLEREGHTLFTNFYKRLDDFYARCKELINIRVAFPEKPGTQHTNGDKILADPGKILICAGPYMSGRELYDKLRLQYHLQPEMYAGNYVLAIMTICDRQEGFERLYEALARIDREIDNSEVNKDTNDKIQEAFGVIYGRQPVMEYLPCEAEELEHEKTALVEAGGRISCEYIYLYPPGIPFIVPGERVEEEVLKALLYLQNEGYELQGLADKSGKSLLMAIEDNR